MSQPPENQTDELQFEVAEVDVPNGTVASATARPTCVACRQPIGDAYFAVGDKVVCPSCRVRIDAPPPGVGIGRLAKSTVSGIGAGLVGAAIWFAIRKVAHLQIGLVAVLVGFLVGKAVRAGSGNRGGRGYQVLAVAITYGCIAVNYMPDVYQGLMAARDRPAATRPGSAAAPPRHVSNLPMPVKMAIRLTATFVASLVLPFLMATTNPIGLLIIGFALWEAWKFNARRQLPITGPHRTGGQATARPLGLYR